MGIKKITQKVAAETTKRVFDNFKTKLKAIGLENVKYGQVSKDDLTIIKFSDGTEGNVTLTGRVALEGPAYRLFGNNWLLEGEATRQITVDGGQKAIFLTRDDTYAYIEKVGSSKFYKINTDSFKPEDSFLYDAKFFPGASSVFLQWQLPDQRDLAWTIIKNYKLKSIPNQDEGEVITENFDDVITYTRTISTLPEDYEQPPTPDIPPGISNLSSIFSNFTIDPGGDSVTFTGESIESFLDFEDDNSDAASNLFAPVEETDFGLTFQKMIFVLSIQDEVPTVDLLGTYTIFKYARNKFRLKSLHTESSIGTFPGLFHRQVDYSYDAGTGDELQFLRDVETVGTDINNGASGSSGPFLENSTYTQTEINGAELQEDNVFIYAFNRFLHFNYPTNDIFDNPELGVIDFALPFLGGSETVIKVNKGDPDLGVYQDENNDPEFFSKIGTSDPFVDISLDDGLTPTPTEHLGFYTLKNESLGTGLFWFNDASEDGIMESALIRTEINNYSFIYPTVELEWLDSDGNPNGQITSITTVAKVVKETEIINETEAWQWFGSQETTPSLSQEGGFKVSDLGSSQNPNAGQSIGFYAASGLRGSSVGYGNVPIQAIPNTVRIVTDTHIFSFDDFQTADATNPQTVQFSAQPNSSEIIRTIDVFDASNLILKNFKWNPQENALKRLNKLKAKNPQHTVSDWWLF